MASTEEQKKAILPFLQVDVTFFHLCATRCFSRLCHFILTHLSCLAEG